MSDIQSDDKIYKLLGELSQDSPIKGLSTRDDGATDNNQALTDAYITTMYFSALANLNFQNLLPERMDDLMPRFKIAFDRTYADFTTAKDWLSSNGAELISTSSAKAYYDEIQAMDTDCIIDIPTAYSLQD